MKTCGWLSVKARNKTDVGAWPRPSRGIPHAAPAPAALEFGIYRDGDNNLDHEPVLVINQALSVAIATRQSSSSSKIRPRGVACSTKERCEPKAT